MRVIVTILAIIVVVAIVAVATGFVSLHGNSGSLPKVAVFGGTFPTVQANIGTIDVGTKNQSVDVPKLSVDTAEKNVAVPVVHVSKPQ